MYSHGPSCNRHPIRYRLCMKHLTLVILLALAALSSGEDAYYCVEELNYKIEDNDSNGLFELQRYNEAKFTLKYMADSNQLAFKGRTYGDEVPFKWGRL